MAFTDNIKEITPATADIKNNTPVLIVDDKVLVGGIGGNFIPAGQKEAVSAGYLTISDSVITFHDITNSTATEVDKLYITDTGVEQPEYQSSGGGSATSMDFYKCASVNTSDSTWSGYKATLQEGKIAGYESDAASGLTYTGVLPVVGHIYTDDARLEIASDIPRDAVFYAPLTTSNTTLTGQTLSNNNVYFYSDQQSYDSSIIHSSTAVFNGSSTKLVTQDITGIPSGASPRCISVWAKINGASGTSMVIAVTDGAIGDGTITSLHFVYQNGTHTPIFGTFGSGPAIRATPVQAGIWHHYACNITSDSFAFYIDGALVDSISNAGMTDAVSEVDIGALRDDPASTYNRYFNGRILAARIYARALSQFQISTLAAQFTPTSN